MQEKLFIAYYLLFILGLLTGIARYRTLDGATRVLVILLFFTAAAELTTYWLLKTEQYRAKMMAFHVWSVAELVIISWYFIKLNKPYHHVRLMALACILWPVMGCLNIIFLQPLRSLNTNMLMLESLSIITLSMYSILQLLRKSASENLFLNPHFWTCILWVVLWGSTFFFWAFIKILYKNGWEYRDTALVLHAVVNVIVYTGLAAVLLFYPKMKIIENR